jgi:ribosomal protein S27E
MNDNEIEGLRGDLVANAYETGHLVPMDCPDCGDSFLVPAMERFCPECGRKAHTYFGGKTGWDLICFDNTGKITHTGGELKDVLEIAERLNWAVAWLIPIKFTKKRNEP